MCGRFALYTSLTVIRNHFNIKSVSGEFKASYNVAPTHEVAVIIEKRLGKLNWGLVPSWAEDLSGAARLINARAETLSRKPSFKNLLKSKRCCVIADGFYEWKKEGTVKQPYYITLPSGDPFAFAGLYDTWKGPDGSPYHSCTIITIDACQAVATIHNRMPVILQPLMLNVWLDAGIDDTSRLEQVLREGYETDLLVRPVSTRVNSPKNNDEKCIAAEN
jgi:putative SOS response-associated peptidase YedK